MGQKKVMFEGRAIFVMFQGKMYPDRGFAKFTRVKIEAHCRKKFFLRVVLRQGVYSQEKYAGLEAWLKQ
jgi:hypothetical protein